MDFHRDIFCSVFASIEMFAANSLSSGRTFRREEEERVRRKRRGRVLWRQIRIRPSLPSFRRAGAIDIVRQKGNCQLGSRDLGVVLINNRKFRIYCKKRYYQMIRDGCSTALYTADTVDKVDTFDTVFTIQTTLCYLNSSLFAYLL